VRLTDDLSLAHGASYMRRWHRSSTNTGGLIVHKGCHDLDLICWLLDTQPVKVASFGGFELFARPAPASHCSVCPERGVCPYVDTGAYEARTPAEAADPTAFGLDRCVYGSDVDIVDNQVVAFELSGGARGTYALAMRNPGRSERRIALVGEHGRLDGVFERGVYDVTTSDGAAPVHRGPPGDEASGHGGGDVGALKGFLKACHEPWRWSPEEAAEVLRGLVFALAAEQARLDGGVVSVGPDLAILTQGRVEAHLGP
jgi:predicted dehydrogenase